MEESEKRRERLKAMRVEAAQAGDPNNPATYDAPSQGLSNPLIDAPAPSPVLPSHTSSSQRFDFYTDPMEAFSGDRRRGKAVNHQAPQQQQQGFFTPPRPRIPVMTPSPAYQARPSYSLPDQRMFNMQGMPSGSDFYRSPMGMASPRGFQQGISPGVWSGPSGTFGNSSPSNLSQGGNFHSPGLGLRGSPRFSSARSRGQYSPSSSLGRGGRHSPYSVSGRGQWSDNRNRSPRQSGGKRFGSKEIVSAELRPDVYYDKSFLEDPWKFLSPVVLKREIVPEPDSSKSWLPESIRLKKGRVSETTNKPSSEPSLAEYLAASFHEAADNEAAIEETEV